MTGYSEEDLADQEVTVFYLNGKDHEFVGVEKYEYRNHHGTGTVETRWKCKDGRIIDILLRRYADK